MLDDLSLPQLGLSLAAGGLTTLSPCVFPMLPLVLGGSMQGNRLAPLAMGMGMRLSHPTTTAPMRKPLPHCRPEPDSFYPL